MSGIDLRASDEAGGLCFHPINNALRFVEHSVNEFHRPNLAKAPSLIDRYKSGNFGVIVHFCINIGGYEQKLVFIFCSYGGHKAPMGSFDLHSFNVEPVLVKTCSQSELVFCGTRERADCSQNVIPSQMIFCSPPRLENFEIAENTFRGILATLCPSVEVDWANCEREVSLFSGFSSEEQGARINNLIQSVPKVSDDPIGGVPQPLWWRIKDDFMELFSGGVCLYQR